MINNKDHDMKTGNSSIKETINLYEPILSCAFITQLRNKTDFQSKTVELKSTTKDSIILEKGSILINNMFSATCFSCQIEMTDIIRLRDSINTILTEHYAHLYDSNRFFYRH